MGQIHSQAAPGVPFIVNPRRLNIHEFQCFFNAGDQTTSDEDASPVSAVPVITAIPDTLLPGAFHDSQRPHSMAIPRTFASSNGHLKNTSEPLASSFIPIPQASSFITSNRRISVVTQDQRPLTFVLDPETNEMLLQLPYQPSYTFRFSLTMFLSPGTASTRLYFAHAGSAAELEVIISTNQTELWTEVRQWAQPAYPRTHKLDFLFVWDAQEDRVGGQPVHFAFFVDDRTETVLTPRTGAAVWVSERPNGFFEDLPSPGSPTQASNATQVSTTQASAIPLASSLASTSQMQAPNQVNTVAASVCGAGSASLTAQSGQTALNSVTNPHSSPGGVPYGVPLAQFDPGSQALRPDSSHLFEPEDGPQFRSAIASMERRVPHIKIRIKQLLKRSLMSRERMQALIEADNWLASGIQEASRQDCTSLRPIADWYSRTSEGGLSAIQRQRKVCLNELTTRLIEPLQRYYEYDIKCFEQQKREFEEKSSQFYSWTSRYLSARKEARRSRTGESSDAKFALKKRSFDVARFDYFSYLNDLTTGLKQQVLLQLAALAAQSMTDSHIALGSELANRTQQNVDGTVEDIKRAAREWETHRMEKQQYRKSLLDDAGLSSQQPQSQTQQLQKETDKQGSPEIQGGLGIYKEGLLWASNRPAGVQDSQGPNKQSLQNTKWHKYWVVLNGSSLREFSNWKQTVDLHNEPINLLVACVREARNTERRFCFEVVTPQYKRVYQATSEDDMRLWITSIHQSISTMLENTEDQSLASSPPRESDFEHSRRTSNSVMPANNLPAMNPILISSSHLSSHSAENGSPRINNGIDALTRKLSLKSEKPRVPPIVTSVPYHNSIQSFPAQISLQKTVLQTPVYTPTLETPQSTSVRISSGRQEFARSLDSAGPQATPIKTSPFDELLFRIHSIPSNRCCAECRTTRSVEWVSINLLVVLCIECSGAHRSLGAHISKVRSLTLDTGAFTSSLRCALLAVSNDQINQIWEAQLPSERKISPDASSQARVKFVSEKYVEKQYIREVKKPNAALRRAIAEQNVHGVCAALASRANPNGVSDADEPMLILALRSVPPTDVMFPAAEVLLKNGAYVPARVYEGLSENAQTFLSARKAQS